MNLYRNNTGTVFPYEIPGLISITGSSAGAAYFYYFYDWEVVKDPCISPRTPVQLIMDEVSASASISTVGMTANVVANTSNNATQYIWNFGDNTSSTLFTPSHLYTVPGTYPVTLIANNDNCSDTVSFEIVVDNAGIIEDENNTWDLYPNPVQDILFVHSNAIRPTYFIYDASGRKVRSGKLEGFVTEINLVDFARGTYRFELRHFDGTKYVKPFVKLD